MRPLVLKIRGLRSYREEVEIDFRDRDLFAIIGDTGAGKSSILDALCFALYGTATWSGKAVTDLISSGAAALSVELSFRADDRIWTVNRTARAGPGASLHKLVANDDPSLHFDAAATVNEKIEGLVGLDYKGFLRAVVLPQGRFQQLLQSTPGERSAVLKAIFRVDELEAVRAAALTVRSRVVGPLSDVRYERAKYLADPSSAADAADGAAGTAKDRLVVVEAAAVAIGAARTSADDDRNRATRLEAHADAISRVRRPGDAQQIRGLAALEAELSRLLNDALERAGAHETSASAIAAELNAADQLGLGAAGLSSAVTTLESAIVALPEINDEAAALAGERARLVELGGKISADENSFKRLEQKATDARAAARLAEQLATGARDSLDGARAALQTARRLVGERGAAVSEHQAAVEGHENLTAQFSAAQDAHRAAVDSRVAADVQLEEVRRKDHAAAAAAGRGPGDPCPVCTRELPFGFAPPHAEGEAGARRARDEAAREEQETLGASKRLEGLVEAAALAVSNVAKKQADAEAKAKTSLDQLERRLPSAHLADDDALLLAPLVVKAGEAADASTGARTAAQEAELAVNTTGTALDGLRAQLSRRTPELHSRTTRLENRRKQQADAIAALPVDVRPEAPGGLAELEEACALAALRLKTIRESEQERDRENDVAGSARKVRDALAARIHTEVRLPAAAVERNQAALEQCLGTVAAELDLPAPVSSGPHETLTATAATAAARDARAGELLRSSKDGSADAVLRAEEAGERIAKALADAGCADAEGLRQQTIEVAADLRQAEAQRDDAMRQQPIVAALDLRISGANGLVAVLDVIYSQLSDAKFIDYVIRRRQLVLLAVASEIFASMTNARYGFAEDFRIVDRWSGQPRDVMTLSGGETFLASLSLALALVELAGRGGGRLEAVFLDEGFGSLDANTLPDALRALEQQASGGRLVAVVSHLRAVAETIDHVLQVTRQPEGSKARWLTPQQRDALLNSDAESGLLT